MTRDEQLRFAIIAWDFAVTLSIGSVPPGPERDDLMAAKEEPDFNTICAVLAIGRHQPWLRLIEDALIEIGLAAVDDTLKGGQA